MPGRGQYWKKGGLIDETVKEEDLSQALQTKVNSSGGYDSISDEGGEILAQRTEINFTGAGVEATDVGGRTVVTIPSGGYDPLVNDRVLEEMNWNDFTGAFLEKYSVTGTNVNIQPNAGGNPGLNTGNTTTGGRATYLKLWVYWIVLMV